MRYGAGEDAFDELMTVMCWWRVEGDSGECILKSFVELIWPYDMRLSLSALTCMVGLEYVS